MTPIDPTPVEPVTLSTATVRDPITLAVAVVQTIALVLIAIGVLID